jgi:hypothetical protein
MMFFVVAIMFGMIAALVAADKGRSPIGWFVTGFLIGPFSLAVIALPRKLAAGRFAECPACLEIVREDAAVCRHCGTEFE